MKIRVLALLTLAAAAAPTLAYGADKEQRQMMADLRILQEQSQQLQNLLATLSEALKAVNSRLDEQAGQNRKAFADEKLAIDTLNADLRIVREKVDDSNVRVGSLSQELDALRQTVAAAAAAAAASAARPSPIETDPTAAAASPADAAPPAPAPVGAAGVGASPKKLLDSAMADYYAGQYDLAIIGFESYIKTFPQSQDADDAQYYVGNSFLNQGKYERAVDAYNLTIRNYPKGNVIPDVYYKLGTALKSLKQGDKAREAFSFVIKTYPDTQAATLAQQQMQQLSPQKP
ncbi:MAG: tol-pal system protein YbgF [Acidobacteria bacterium]|nr:MAG: tol-pal system protein YbgF [Acidobacteriota bacterium]PYR51325.1 MAG: tol-pal system protein YbgF [Acidobacteriota bacterium]